jgi:hypothetical protein
MYNLHGCQMPFCVFWSEISNNAHKAFFSHPELRNSNRNPNVVSSPTIHIHKAFFSQGLLFFFCLLTWKALRFEMI